MSVLDRSALEASPLADLHTIASELGIDSFRRLRKADLVDVILARQEGVPAASPDDEVEAVEASATDAEDSSDADDGPEARDDADEDDDKPRPRRRRGGRGRGRKRDADGDDDGGRGRRRDADTDDDGPVAEASTPDDEPENAVEGTVELLGGGSGFIRVDPPEPSDDDVYISAAQVRRCELVSGDVVTGPVRKPRRSERYPSLVRVDTINGTPADEVAAGTRFDDLPATFPAERLALGSEDPTVRAIEWLTPFGKGSRVVITGASRAGKTEALRRIAAALAGVEGVELLIALAGVRPEEVPGWNAGEPAPVATATFAASPDAQGQAVERMVEQGRRVAARGRDAVVLIDTLDYLGAGAARKTLAAARNIVDGGSLTIIATSAQPHGGETTVVALDVGLASTARFPAVDLAHSGTIRPDLLVGEAGADAIAKARATALGLPEQAEV